MQNTIFAFIQIIPATVSFSPSFFSYSRSFLSVCICFSFFSLLFTNNASSSFNSCGLDKYKTALLCSYKQVEEIASCKLFSSSLIFLSLYLALLLHPPPFLTLAQFLSFWNIRMHACLHSPPPVFLLFFVLW
jgi:uncharacterized membrane protein